MMIVSKMSDLRYIAQPDSSLDDKSDRHAYWASLRSGVAHFTKSKYATKKFEGSELHGASIEFPLSTSAPNFNLIVEEKIKNGLLKNTYWIAISVVNYAIKPIGKLGRLKMQLSSLRMTIISTKKADIARLDAQLIYDILERNANQFISKYKFTPGRHNHDLVKLNHTRVGPFVPIYRFSLNDTAIDLKCEVILTETPGMNNISNQRSFTKNESDFLGSPALLNSEMSLFYEPIYRLVRARDLNCTGEFDLAILLAASTIEGFLRAVEYEIRVSIKKQKAKTVREEIEKSEIGDLKKFAKDEYSLSTSRKSIYGKWYKGCYLLRNDFTHKQNNFTPTKSNEAIQLTIALIIEVCELFEKNYHPNSLNLIRSIALGQNNIARNKA